MVSHLVFTLILIAVTVQLSLVTSSPLPDPDLTRLIPELITSRGFIHEAHSLITSDGYILGIHRLINPLTKKYIKGIPKSVLIQCGLLCSGSEFLDNSAGGYLNESMLADRHNVDDMDFTSDFNNLGFVLANLGYDVWLFHPRGNFYSRNHTTMDPNKDRVFWEFTFDEIALFDLPTTIDYILKLTKQSNIGYIGYSQGGTTIYALLSDRPEYSSKVVPIISIAPAVRLDDYQGLPFQAILEAPLVMSYVKSKGGECFGFMVEEFVTRCNENMLMRLICNFITYDLLSVNKKQVDPDRVDIFFSHIPSGTSCWNILHLLQVMVNKSFAKFDYGKTDNLIKYNSTSPPVYDLSKVVSNDMYIVASIGDHSADQKDIALLKSLLTSVPEIVEHTIQDKTFDHLDYFMSKHTGPYVNGPIAKMLKKYNR